MPQFDSITFFNQVFWLFIFIFVSYNFILKIVLPFIAQSLKIRRKKLSYIVNNLNSLNIEQVSEISVFEIVIKKTLVSLKENLSRFDNETFLWGKFIKETFFQTEFAKINKQFEKIVFEKVVYKSSL